jgi:hypothetical protein
MVWYASPDRSPSSVHAPHPKPARPPALHMASKGRCVRASLGAPLYFCEVSGPAGKSPSDSFWGGVRRPRGRKHSNAIALISRGVVPSLPKTRARFPCGNQRPRRSDRQLPRGNRGFRRSDRLISTWESETSPVQCRILVWESRTSLVGSVNSHMGIEDFAGPVVNSHVGIEERTGPSDDSHAGNRGGVGFELPCPETRRGCKGGDCETDTSWTRVHPERGRATAGRATVTKNAERGRREVPRTSRERSREERLRVARGG